MVGQACFFPVEIRIQTDMVLMVGRCLSVGHATRIGSLKPGACIAAGTLDHGTREAAEEARAATSMD